MGLPVSVGRPVYHLYQLAWRGLDWIYPPRCGGCGQMGSRWCADCHSSVKILPDSICRRCGRPQAVVGICENCQHSPPSYTALRSWAVFNGSLRSALHRLKYKGDIALGEVLSHPLVEMLHRLNWEIDLVVPVPVGVDRLAQRGYNQASMLALPVALSIGTSYEPWGLKKVRETRSQVGLSATERRENVIGAFQGDQIKVEHKQVLVIDDVTTSGATMEVCAEALLEAGAQEVYCLTLARAMSTM